MSKEEIERILESYEESYAPWELEEGYCDIYTKDKMIEFGKRMYELGLRQNQNKDEK
jgi:hypothetical protein